MPPLKEKQRKPKKEAGKEKHFFYALHKRDARINAAKDKMWAAGINAPMFASTVNVGTQGKTMKRKTHLISKYAYDVATSGAISARSAEQAMECEWLCIPFSNDIGCDEYGKRVDNKVIAEDDKSLKDIAARVSFSPGAKLMLGQFCADYVQEGRIMADGVRRAIGHRTRVIPAFVREAFKELAQRTGAVGHGASCETFVVPVWKKALDKKRKREETAEEEDEAENREAPVAAA